jgi:hypothetical protein
MALGLFAQIGLVSHLFSLLAPAMGMRWAGVAMGFATGTAIVGRTCLGWFLPAGTDRRTIAATNYGIQIAGCAALVAAGGTDVPLLLIGTILFGLGIGNVTSLPPLIAQAEFARDDVARTVALIIAISQAGYAFAPATFGILRAIGGHDSAPAVFLVAAGFQAAAATIFLLGRRDWTRRTVTR